MDAACKVNGVPLQKHEDVLYTHPCGRMVAIKTTRIQTQVFSLDNLLSTDPLKSHGKSVS